MRPHVWLVLVSLILPALAAGQMTPVGGELTVAQAPGVLHRSPPTAPATLSWCGRARGRTAADGASSAAGSPGRAWRSGARSPSPEPRQGTSGPLRSPGTRFRSALDDPGKHLRVSVREARSAATIFIGEVVR